MVGADRSWRAQAVIFDLDGTLVDNMALHADAFEHFVAAHGLPSLDEEMRKRLDGRRNRDIFPILFERSLEEADLKQFAREKETHYRELSRGRLEALPGLVEFLDELERRGVPYGISTSAPAENVEHNLNEIGLRERFRIIVRSDQVERGKPFPDVFLRTAELLETPAADCLAFEDAPAGVQSAGSAGMRCCGITTSFSATMLGAAHPLLAATDNYQSVLEDPTHFGLNWNGE